MKSQQQIDDMFDHHPPLDVNVPRHEVIRQGFKDLATVLALTLPEGNSNQMRCNALAYTKLEEAAMWANKSIAYLSTED
jgi:hypothetical protein